MIAAARVRAPRAGGARGMPESMNWGLAWPYFLAAFAIGYLFGSIPFGVLLTRAAGLGDVRNIGSGNIGATNVLRTGRKDPALATPILDGGQGALAAGPTRPVVLRPRPGGLVPGVGRGAAFLPHPLPPW